MMSGTTIPHRLPTSPKNWSERLLTVSVIVGVLLALARPFQAASVLPDSSPNYTVNLHVNLTSAAPSGAVSIVSRYNMEVPACRSVDQPIPQLRICPSMLLEDGDHCSPPMEDPLRVPRVIRQAACLCIHCPGMKDQPCCKEHHVTIPVIHCDKDPEVEQPSECTLSLQRVSESCVCTRSATS